MFHDAIRTSKCGKMVMARIFIHASMYIKKEVSSETCSFEDESWSTTNKFSNFSTNIGEVEGVHIFSLLDSFREYVTKKITSSFSKGSIINRMKFQPFYNDSELHEKVAPLSI